MHREAALFLGEGVAAAKAIVTHKLLVKACRGDQARLSHTISTHRRGCVLCRIPHP